MDATEHMQALGVLREQMRDRLGLELREFYTDAEIIGRWIEPGLTAGQTSDEIANEFVQYFHDKYDLMWMSGNESCVVCGARFDAEQLRSRRRLACGPECEGKLVEEYVEALFPASERQRVLDSIGVKDHGEASGMRSREK